MYAVLVGKTYIAVIFKYIDKAYKTFVQRFRLFSVFPFQIRAEISDVPLSVYSEPDIARVIVKMDMAYLGTLEAFLRNPVEKSDIRYQKSHDTLIVF